VEGGRLKEGNRIENSSGKVKVVQRVINTGKVSPVLIDASNLIDEKPSQERVLANVRSQSGQYEKECGIRVKNVTMCP